MSIYSSGDVVTFKFIFNLDGYFYDPVKIYPNWESINTSATPYYGLGVSDITVSVVRGHAGNGPIISGPYSYGAQSATPDYAVSIIQQINSNSVLKQILSNNYIKRESKGIYNFVYKIPENIFDGKYTVILNALVNGVREVRELYFQIVSRNNQKPIYIEYKQIENNTCTLTTVDNNNLSSGEIITLSEVDSSIDGVYEIKNIKSSKSFTIEVLADDMPLTVLIPTGRLLRHKSNSPVVVDSNPSLSVSSQVNAIFKTLEPFKTNSVLLIGHADSAYLELNELKRISSIKEAMDLLGGNKESPLLKAVINCNSAGCKDIYIMIAAPMSEYVENSQELNSPIAGFLSENSATPTTLTFYEKYYERLKKSYDTAKEFDFIDIVVPVDASFIRCGNVNFVRQLSDFCEYIYKNSSTIVIGIIGSRTGGMNNEDAETMSASNYYKNFLLDSNQNTPNYKDETDGNTLDAGRHIMLFYGEAVYNYPLIGLSYSSSVASSVAGQLSETPVYKGLNRKRLIGAYSPHGVSFSSLQIAKIHNNKINTLIKSGRSRRNVPYQVLLSDDRTLASNGSSMSNIPQVRLAAMITNEINAICDSATGKFSYDIIKEKIQQMLNSLKISTPSILRDYRFEMYADKQQRGKVYVEIDLISSHAIKKISLNILAGPGV